MRYRYHRVAQLIVAGGAHLCEVGSCGIGQLHRKFEIAHFRQRIRELIDGVVADWDRAVATGVDRLQTKVLECFLADLDILLY